MWWEALPEDAQGEACSDFHIRSSLQEQRLGEGARPSEQASQEPVGWSLQGLTLVGYTARGGYRANGTSKL